MCLVVELNIMWVVTEVIRCLEAYIYVIYGGKTLVTAKSIGKELEEAWI